MEHYKFSVEGKQFKPSYIIYVIRVCTEVGTSFIYVGQTGDRNHVTARPPFRRLAGHVEELNKSTQNQLYKGILEKILKIDIGKEEKYTKCIKRKAAKFLEQSGIDMIVFPIMDFPESIEIEIHKKNVKHIENIEKNVIEMLVDKFGGQALLNKKFHKPGDDQKAKQIAFEIIDRLKKELPINVAGRINT